MAETESIILDGLPESSLITLYIRAMESKRPDALINDEKAVELISRESFDFSHIRQIQLSEVNKLIIILRTLEFDRFAQDFLRRHPNAIVVHIGCGFDARFERVACTQLNNSQLEWYDLDLPEVIELRRKFIGNEKEHYHLVGCSVLDNAWLDVVRNYQPRPFLFLAEGVSMHLQEAQVKSMVLTLRDNFPGAELVFDAYSPIHLLVSNLQTAKAGIRFHWGIWHGKKIEGWREGIYLLDEWGYFDSHEPRLAFLWWMRPFEILLRTLRIYHFQLGEAAQ